VAELVAGSASIRAATGGWHGALRPGPRARPVWTCAHVHATPATAKPCAERELERRRQGARAVFTLLHCARCDEGGGSAWWADAPGALECPRCSVPLERVKLAVLERGPAVDQGNGKH
jgi:hypothetical protein